MLITNLLSGIVVETKAQSFTGSFLYSDVRHTKIYPNILYGHDPESGSFGFYPSKKWGHVAPSPPYLNKVAQIPVIGIVAGITRVALGVLHTFGHLFAALITQNKGHLWHAAKGGCEMIRGLIEAIPLVGRVFSLTYGIPFIVDYLLTGGDNRFCWWMIKMYNPEAPDDLDRGMSNWKSFPSAYYVKA